MYAVPVCFWWMLVKVEIVDRIFNVGSYDGECRGAGLANDISELFLCVGKIVAISLAGGTPLWLTKFNDNSSTYLPEPKPPPLKLNPNTISNRGPLSTDYNNLRGPSTTPNLGKTTAPSNGTTLSRQPHNKPHHPHSTIVIHTHDQEVDMEEEGEDEEVPDSSQTPEPSGQQQSTSEPHHNPTQHPRAGEFSTLRNAHQLLFIEVNIEQALTKQATLLAKVTKSHNFLITSKSPCN
eukprot:gene4846-9653_t